MNFIVKLFLSAIAVAITGYLLKGGVHIDTIGYALIVAAVLALLNISVKPLLIFLTIPATIISLGLFLLVINALIIEIAAWILAPNFRVDSFWYALGFSIILSVINSIFDRLTVKPEYRDDSVKVFDKDGNIIA